MIAFEATPAERVRLRAMPGLTKDRQGRIEPTLPNLVMILGDPSALGCALGSTDGDLRLRVKEPNGALRLYTPFPDRLLLLTRLEALGFRHLNESTLDQALAVIRAVYRFNSFGAHVRADPPHEVPS